MLRVCEKVPISAFPHACEINVLQIICRTGFRKPRLQTWRGEVREADQTSQLIDLKG
jgi:hypothetical protein